VTLASGSTRPYSILLLAFVTGFGLSILLIGNLVFSGFSVLDDHQIIELVGSSGRLPARQIWSTLMSSPLNSSSPRFQPILYLVHIVEASIFGDNPLGYHVVQVVWFGIFLWAVGWAAFRTIGIVSGLAILFLTVNFKFWAAIWTYSLWVSEQLAVMGFGLVIFGVGGGFIWFTHGYKTKIDGAVLLIGIGSLICLGVKENFMFLLGPFVGLLIFAWIKGKLSSAALFLSLGILLLETAICYEIIQRNWGRPTDIYGQDNSIFHRLTALVESSLIWPVIALTVLGSLVLGFATRYGRKHTNLEFRKMACVGTLLIFSGIYLAWEVFFYTGRLPSNVRYDFPSALSYVVAVSVLLYLAFYTVCAWFPRKTELFHFGVQLASSAAVLAGISYASNYVYLPLIEGVARSNARTIAMTRAVDESKKLTAQHPNWPIIIAPSYPLDYEAVLTLPLWFNDIHNPITVSVTINPQKITSPFDQWLVNEMRSWSKEGVSGRLQPSTSEVERAEAMGECYEIAFEDQKTKCVLLPYRPHAYLP
jgi:hypothetical protein